MQYVEDNSGDYMILSMDEYHDIVNIIIHGLATDGAHHKQYDLMEVYKMLHNPEFNVSLEKIKELSDIEEGIPA